MLENIDKNSPEFDNIFLSYWRAKDLDKEADLIRKLNLTEQDIRLLEKEIALADACGDFDILQQEGVNVDLGEYLKQRGFFDEDIERAKYLYKVTDSIAAKTKALFSDKEIDEIFGQIQS